MESTLKKNLLIAFVFISALMYLIFMRKSDEKASNLNRRQDLEKIISTTSYKRYILVKGNNIENVEDAMDVYAQTYIIDWKVRYAKYNDWVLIDFTDVDFFEISDYHALTAWFFGNRISEEKLNVNKTDIGISLAIDEAHTNSYLAYLNKDIYDVNQECDLYGVFQNNQKVAMSMCSEIIEDAEDKNIPNFDVALNQFGINLNEVIEAAKKGKEIHVKTQ